MTRIRLYIVFFRTTLLTSIVIEVALAFLAFILHSRDLSAACCYSPLRSDWGWICFIKKDQCYLKEIKEKEELIPYGYYRPG